MCGRFVQKAKPKELAERFDVSVPPETHLTPRYNLAPTQPAAIIRKQDKNRVLDACSWGLVPSWAKDPAIGSKLINARAETVWEKPSFRHAIRYRRCLVPANGFYEWKSIPATGGRSRPLKQPFYFEVENQSLFAFAGLWEVWSDRDGGELFTFTMLTRPANEFMADYHQRMPVILHPGDEAAWLDMTLYQQADLDPIIRGSPPKLHAQSVSRRINSISNDDPECLTPTPALPQQGELFEQAVGSTPGQP